MSLAPIVLFTFNRPEHTAATLDALAQNELAADSELIIYADGPRRQSDNEAVVQTRDVIQSARGFKQVHIRPHEENQGLAKSVIAGVGEVIDDYGRAIVLEDDLLSNPLFLRYMNHYLERYADEEEVISIHGYVYPLEQSARRPYFIQGADCWGWATWKRGWNLFEESASLLLNRIKTDKNKCHRFDFDGNYPYLQMLEDQVAGRIDSWAIRWYASAFLQDRVTLYPPYSLVHNTGLDGSGTHKDYTRKFESKQSGLEESDLWEAPSSIRQDEEMYKEFTKFFKSLKPSLLRRVINRFS